MSLDSDKGIPSVTERTRNALNLSGLDPETIYLTFRTAIRISLSVHQTDGQSESTRKSLGNEKGGIFMIFCTLHCNTRYNINQRCVYFLN